MKFPIFAMYIFYVLTLLKAITSFCVSQNPGICSNVSNGEPLECCPNYRIVGTSCEECWPGSRGVDCAEDCGPGFYGRLCREECSCAPCDKVKGCPNISSGYTYSLTAEQDEGPTRYHWLTILVMSSGGAAICFVVCLTVVCIFRWNSNTRTFSLTKHDSENDDNLPEILRYNHFQRLSKVEASSGTGKETVYPIKSSQIKDLLFTTKANRTDDCQDVYGHIDPMDECYSILKLKVLDEKDDVYDSKSCSTHRNCCLKAENSVSATTSTASNSNNADKLMSNKLIKREKMKHQKDLFRTLNSFKQKEQKDTNERKRLRYSFVKSTELI